MKENNNYKENKNHSLLEKIAGIIFILLIPTILVMFEFASNKIISAGIPIVLFGSLFIILAIFGKDVDDSVRNQKIGKFFIIICGVSIITIGFSIIYHSIKLFIYSFINLFGIMGLALDFSMLYTYIYNKKYCTKKVLTISSNIIDDYNRNSINGYHYSTTRPVFTIINEDGTYGKKLIYDVSSTQQYVINKKYELMVNPNNYNEFYILGEKFYKKYIILLFIANVFIIVSIVANYILLTTSWAIS